MDGTRQFLELVADHGLAKGHLRGVFHIAIGRTLSRLDGTLISSGVTWRELATLLKATKFDKSLVKELGADPDTLSPRDREKFWYAAVAIAGVGTVEARVQADRLALKLERYGLRVGGIEPLPTRNTPVVNQKAEPTPATKADEPAKKPKRKK